MSLADLFDDNNENGERKASVGSPQAKKPVVVATTNTKPVKKAHVGKKVTVISGTDAMNHIDAPVAPTTKKRRVSVKSKTTVSTTQPTAHAPVSETARSAEKSLPTSNTMSASQIAALTPADQALLRMQQMQRKNFPKQLQTLQVWVNAVQKMQLDLGVSVMAGAAVDLCTSGKY